VAAGIAEVPESSAHTSIKARVDHVQDQGRTKDLKAARSGSVAGSTAAAGLEESHWLCPIEDRRRLDSRREGMVEGFSLGNCLLLVDFSIDSAIRVADHCVGFCSRPVADKVNASLASCFFLGGGTAGELDALGGGA
jgi:hypothetical protein